MENRARARMPARSSDASRTKAGCRARGTRSSTAPTRACGNRARPSASACPEDALFAGPDTEGRSGPRRRRLGEPRPGRRHGDPQDTAGGCPLERLMQPVPSLASMRLRHGPSHRTWRIACMRCGGVTRSPSSIRHLTASAVCGWTKRAPADDGRRGVLRRQPRGSLLERRLRGREDRADPLLLTIEHASANRWE